jgi:hypothetical protein
MENQQTQRLLYDTECKDCTHKSMCEWADTPQCCRGITDRLRVELKNNRKHREIVDKIVITTEYVYNKHNMVKTVSDNGMFVLKKPYIFGETFSRAEITGKCDGGKFSTRYFGWKKR